MKTNDAQRDLSLWLLAGLCSLLFLGASGLSLSYAQGNSQVPDREGPYVSEPVAPVEMESDLSTMPIEVPQQVEPVEVPLRGEAVQDGSRSVATEESPALQTFAPQEAGIPGLEVPPEFSMPNPNFDGINQGDPGANFTPPDTNGDVGPNHYVQTVNSAIAIFDKQGATLAGPMRINLLFAPLGGPCATDSITILWAYSRLPLDQ